MGRWVKYDKLKLAVTLALLQDMNSDTKTVDISKRLDNFLSEAVLILMGEAFMKYVRKK